MIKKVLVANRGEIAVRILRTLKEMNLASVAVYSEADEKALHVFEADESVCLGAPEPAASYLNIEKIIEAAKNTDSDAIHPGYGFLSESPAFAKAVTDAGLTFIGPRAEAMSLLGDKTRARRLMQQSGVPIIPGLTKPESDPEKLQAAAEDIGYPLLIKASAGGGGKGMRVVNDPSLLADACRDASSEAGTAFGDGSIYLEKYLERPRHVEIQILADEHGQVVHLFERECSIQRRHQKIIEEAPSPFISEKTRQAMGQAAIAAAKAAGYTNAGTVEFLVDSDESFYFLEVNARIQVEHPVTEMITGLDLVRRQIDIANGYKLPFAQEDLQIRGHAIECRIYAEDAAQNFAPSPGKILAMHEPAGPGIRHDCGVYEGYEVPVHYDPILSKLIVHAEDRPAALAKMIRALERTAFLGVRTSVDFLLAALRSEAFRQGDTTTDFIERHFGDWKPDDALDVMAAAYVADQLLPSTSSHRDFVEKQDAGLPTPWQTLGKWDLES